MRLLSIPYWQEIYSDCSGLVTDVAMKIGESYQSTRERIFFFVERVSKAVHNFFVNAYSLFVQSSPIIYSGAVGVKKTKQKILFLNGSMYTHEGCKEAATKISEIFKTKVDYLYIPMSISQVIWWLVTGREIEGSESLTNKIRESISKHEKKNLLVIVHSGGGVILDRAKRELTGEERKKIDVVTIGSVRLFKEKGFHSVRNFAAQRDFVPGCSGLFSGAFFHDEGPVERVGPKWQFPLTSHEIYQPHYIEALKSIKAQEEQAVKS